MSTFRGRRKGSVQVELPPYAAQLIASLARQLVELLQDGESREPVGADPLEAMLDFDAPRDVPEDPALLRLLPDARPDDAEASAEFRRFTEKTLRDTKADDALIVIRSIGEIGDDDTDDVEFEIDAPSARAWLRCLTDMRLTLAARLGVVADDEEHWSSLPADDPRLAVYEIYGWLGYLLESLLDEVRT